MIKIHIEFCQDMVRIKDIMPFDLQASLECGQAFRWERRGPGFCYVGVAGRNLLKVKQDGGDFCVLNIGECFPDLDFIVHYFDLEADYKVIEDALRAVDPIMCKVIGHGSGLRILRQDPWECLISFIISANNRIPLIRKAIANLAERFGEEVSHSDTGERHYAFPEARCLASASIEELQRCGVGFRAEYIREAARIVTECGFDFGRLRYLDLDSARTGLMKFRGVGSKVADCVLLFSLQHYSAFPIDIWIARVMRYLYFGGENVSLNEIQKFSRNKFGNLAGYAQEYLYYYARELLAGEMKGQQGNKDSRKIESQTNI